MMSGGRTLFSKAKTFNHQLQNYSVKFTERGREKKKKGSQIATQPVLFDLQGHAELIENSFISHGARLLAKPVLWKIIING